MRKCSTNGITASHIYIIDTSIKFLCKKTAFELENISFKWKCKLIFEKNKIGIVHFHFKHIYLK